MRAPISPVLNLAAIAISVSGLVTSGHTQPIRDADSFPFVLHMERERHDLDTAKYRRALDFRVDPRVPVWSGDSLPADRVMALRAERVADGDLQMANLCPLRSDPHVESRALIIRSCGSERYRVIGISTPHYEPRPRLPDSLYVGADSVWAVEVRESEMVPRSGRIGRLRWYYFTWNSGLRFLGVGYPRYVE